MSHAEGLNRIFPSVKEPKSLTGIVKDSSYLLPFLAGFFALIAPAGYLIGLGYQAGYLGQFGVTTSAFPLSITDGYVYGYYAILFYVTDLFTLLTDINLWKGIAYTLVGAFVIFLLFVKAVRYGHPESEKHIPPPDIVKEFFSRFHPSKNDFTAALVLFYKALSVISAVVYLVLVFLAIWVSMTVFSHQKGAQQAFEAKRQFVQNGCDFNEHSLASNCITIVNQSDQPIIEGLLIALDDKKYAIFTEHGPVISELPEGAKILKHFDKQSFLNTKMD